MLDRTYTGTPLGAANRLPAANLVHLSALAPEPSQRSDRCLNLYTKVIPVYRLEFR